MGKKKDKVKPRNVLVLALILNGKVKKGGKHKVKYLKAKGARHERD